MTPSRFPLGPLGHVLTDDEHVSWRVAGVVSEGPASRSEDLLMIERVKKGLLE